MNNHGSGGRWHGLDGRRRAPAKSPDVPFDDPLRLTAPVNGSLPLRTARKSAVQFW